MSDHQILAVNVVYEIRAGPSRDTAIDKRPVTGAVVVGELGLDGDTQCDTRNHGGPDKALYAYASEDAAWWAEALDREINPGLFGENLTTCGIDVNGAVIGERWCIGNGDDAVVVEVRMPRTPCNNLSARVGIHRFHHRFGATGRVGAYLKVISPGKVSAGDVLRVEHRPDHGVTIADVLLNRTPDTAHRLLEPPADIADDVRRLAKRIIDRAKRRSPSAPHVCRTSRREPVTDLQALGEAQVLQLAHVEFERRSLTIDHRGQVACPPCRVVGDQVQRRSRPRSV